MVSIISGPCAVGKSYFIENKKDRLLEIAQLDYKEFKGSTVLDWQDIDWLDAAPTYEFIRQYWWQYIVKINDGSKIICIHLNFIGIDRVLNSQSKFKLSFIKKINLPVNVIILGVPYGEYKVRTKDHSAAVGILDYPPGLHLQPNAYKDWVSELNKNEIPYKFVEAVGDYRVLEEKEFFHMVRYHQKEYLNG